MSYHSSVDISKRIYAINHTKRKKCVCFSGALGGVTSPLTFPTSLVVVTRLGSPLCSISR